VSARLVRPVDAGAKLARQVKDKWAAAVCAETRGEEFPFQVSLRPNVTSGAIVERELMDSWGEWRAEWRRLGMPTEAGAGPWVNSPELSVRQQRIAAPMSLHAPDLASAEAALAVLGGGPVAVDVEAAREIAQSMRAAGVLLTPGTLKKVVDLHQTDREALRRVLGFLAEHPDVSHWSARQLPIPRVHTKWLDKFMVLVSSLTGRDLDSELRKRPTVVHLTYVDPTYLARPDNPRKHDSWTAGDSHELAYQPRTVVVVENRDCRVFFPQLDGAIVVEGGGAAATALVAEIPWVRDAERVVYWGDMDTDGYAILARFRAALPKASSILMDLYTMNRHAEQGVSEDKDRNLLKPSDHTLNGLTEDERAAYDMVATAGPAEFRRIEQEKLPIEEAAELVRSR